MKIVCYALFAAASMMCSAAAASIYQLSAGDTIEITVAGRPDLRQKITIPSDGEISLPMFGRFSVTGTTLPDLENRIRQAASERTSKQGNSPRDTQRDASEFDRIAVNISEYRPVYVGGMVAKPGEQQYRPGLTARQAITLAGGYDIGQTRGASGFLDAKGWLFERARLRDEYVLLRVKESRLEAQLAGKASFEMPKFAWSINTQAAKKAYEDEAEVLRIENANLQAEFSSLDRLISKADTQLAYLRDHSAKSKEGLDVDEAELARIRDLQQKGTVPMTRVVEARRSALLASTGTLQGLSQSAQVERETEDLKRKKVGLSDARRLQTLTQIEQTRMRTMNLSDRLQELDFKIGTRGDIMLEKDAVDGSGAVLIFRKDASQTQEFEAPLDTALNPGDVVSVRLN